MAIRHYLAMTGAEYRSCGALPEHLGWLGCHFSPYGPGLSNLPPSLPPDALLILDDITPIHGHDPELITRQLAQILEAGKFRALLLDFQRQGYEEAAGLAARLTEKLAWPVGVSQWYASGDGAVLLPPPPLHCPLGEYLAPWQGREIWLETSPAGEVITLTEAGAAFAPLPSQEAAQEGFCEESLHIHYRLALEDAAARFTLWRSGEDFAGLLEAAQGLGVTLAVGLYQEWSSC